MAYTAGELICVFSAGPGRSIYKHDSDDNVNTIEAAGYFNNVDDNLNLAGGELIHCVVWDGAPFDSCPVPSASSSRDSTTVDPSGAVKPSEVDSATAAPRSAPPAR